MKKRTPIWKKMLLISGIIWGLAPILPDVSGLPAAPQMPSVP